MRRQLKYLHTLVLMQARKDQSEGAMFVSMFFYESFVHLAIQSSWTDSVSCYPDYAKYNHFASDFCTKLMEYFQKKFLFSVKSIS